MFGHDDFDDFDDFSETELPDYFYEWDESLEKNLNPRFLDKDEINEIIEIYLEQEEIAKAKKTVELALKFYPEDEELIYDVLLLLNEYEVWNELLSLSEKYANLDINVWVNGHKLSALLHLGMEEDAFLFFQQLKKKYSGDAEKLSIIYQSMSEALNEVDLFQASLKVVDEFLRTQEPNVELYWTQLQSYLALNFREKVIETADKIEQMNPLDFHTWERLGDLYQTIDDHEKAIEAFEFALSLGLKKESLFIGIINAYQINGNLLRALEKAKDYIYLFPEDTSAYLVAANLSSELELWNEALFFIDSVIKLEPEKEDIYIYKSNILLSMQENKKAILALEEGIRNTKDTKGELNGELERLKNKFSDF